MSAGFGQALLAFAKGTDPPVKAETESLDDFQTRSIDWLKSELKSMRALMWVVVGFHVLQWMRAVGYA